MPIKRLSKTEIFDLAHLAYVEPVYYDHRFPPSLYYRFLRSLAAAQRTRLAVELGVCGGGGSLYMCHAAKRVVGVDITNEYPDNIKHIQDNYANFIFLRGDSVGVASAIHRAYGLIDLLFIDTTHTYEQTMAEYGAYKHYLTSGAIVCLDDLFREGMDKVWAEMPQPKVRLDHLHIGGSATDGGFGVILL